MTRLISNSKTKEVLYLGILIGVLFLMYSLDEEEHIHWYDLVFFGAYTSIALVINYVLLHHFFYKRKILWFWVLVVIVLGLLYFLEEFVLEPLLIGGERGDIVANVFYTLLCIIPYLFMMVGFKLAWDGWQKQQKLEELQLAVRESELRFLKSQINPHFLFNNLNNLYSYAIENSSKTPSIILELSSVLRYMLYDCKEDFVLLHKEIEHLKNFTALNELQIEERGNISLTADDNSKNYCIAPLILSVFVENAFKHSSSSQSENISIAITLNVNDNGLLQFECKNKFQKQTNTQSLSQGIGLDNVKKRLNILYPNQHSLTITTGDLYTVSLQMQLNSIDK